MHRPLKPVQPRRPLSRFVLACLLSAAPTFSQQNAPTPGASPPRAQAADPQQVLTRVYDVRDLLMRLKQYPFRGAMMSARQTQSAAVAGDVPTDRARPPATGPAVAADAEEPTYPERTDELIR